MIITAKCNCSLFLFSSSDDVVAAVLNDAVPIDLLEFSHFAIVFMVLIRQQVISRNTDCKRTVHKKPLLYQPLHPLSVQKENASKCVCVHKISTIFACIFGCFATDYILFFFFIHPSSLLHTNIARN